MRTGCASGAGDRIGTHPALCLGGRTSGAMDRDPTAKKRCAGGVAHFRGGNRTMDHEKNSKSKMGEARRRPSMARVFLRALVLGAIAAIGLGCATFRDTSTATRASAA